MNLLYPVTSWQADNLPEGLSLHNGVISGTPTIKGRYSVPVTVSNQLGTDTKNISIIVKNRPGTEKFSILQDGVEVAKLTIPELQAMVQDGTAQERFNCTNTQIILPVVTPALKYYKYNSSTDDFTHEVMPSFTQNVSVNFCSFRNVTLQDGSTRQGLILQFDKTLWGSFAPFDTNGFNRWRYSNLRQWLNSEGLNWFTPAYDGDTLRTYQELFTDTDADVLEGDFWWSSYADENVHGFLDLLPDDLHSALQPVRVVSQAFFDDENTNSTIEDPEDVDGYDADITYDKVFIPSMREMFLGTMDPFFYSDAEMQAYAEECIEGAPYEFYVHKLSQYAYINFSNNPSYASAIEHKEEWPCFLRGEYSSSAFYGVLFGRNLLEDISTFEDKNNLIHVFWCYRFFNLYGFEAYKVVVPVLTRTPKANSNSGIVSVERTPHPNSGYKTNIYIEYSYEDTNINIANPAPAFVIC